MQSAISFQLNASGFPFKATNPTVNATQISIAYTLNYSAAPSSMLINVEGYSNASGDTVVLDSFSPTISTTPQAPRTVSLNGTNYDLFIITGNWPDGVNVVVNGVLTSLTGAGAVFNPALNLPSIHTQ